MDDQPSLKMRCERFLLDEWDVEYVHNGQLDKLIAFVEGERRDAVTEALLPKYNSIDAGGLSAGGTGTLGNPTLVHIYDAT